MVRTKNSFVASRFGRRPKGVKWRSERKTLMWEAILEIFVKTGAYWAFTIIPGLLAILGAIQSTLPENQRNTYATQMYSYVSPVVWMIFAMIAFGITVTAGAINYVNKKRRSNGVSSPLIEVSGNDNKFENTTIVKASDKAKVVLGDEKNYYSLQEKKTIYSPKVRIEKVDSFLNDSATIRIINDENEDLTDLRVGLFGLWRTQLGDRYPVTFNPSESDFDCGDCKIGYGGRSKDIKIADKLTHNVRFLTVLPVEYHAYESRDTRDICQYDFEIRIYGRYDGNRIDPPLQFCGEIKFWRTSQEFIVQGVSQGVREVSQMDFVKIECENNLRWLIS